MASNYQLFMDTNGDDFVIKLDYRNTYLLYSMLRYVELQEDNVTPEELFLANKIADDIYDYLDDETVEKVFNNEK